MTFIDEIAGKLSQAMPSGIKAIEDDLEKKFKGILQAAFNKLDIVGREEFDVQCKVLARTREKLEALELRLAQLESKTQ